MGGPRTGPPVAPSLDLPPLPPSRAGPAGPDPGYAIIVAVKVTASSKPGALATALSWRKVMPLTLSKLLLQPERKERPSRTRRRPYEAQTNPPPVWEMDQARALTKKLTKEAPPNARRTRIARPISQTGNQGDLSKASPAACFFASFFAPKKEVQDCQGAHSPLILFRGAPTRALLYLAAICRRNMGYPSVTFGNSSPLRRGAKNWRAARLLPYLAAMRRRNVGEPLSHLR